MELTESTAKQELPACPVETTLTLISDKWKVLILRDLMNGTLRFGELKKSIGHVTQKVLTAQLRQMEASGLLTRKVYAEVPPRVEYTLTELGYSLKPVMDALWKWADGSLQIFDLAGFQVGWFIATNKRPGWRYKCRNQDGRYCFYSNRN